MSTLELGYLLNLVILSMTLHYLKGKGSSDDALCKSITVSIAIMQHGDVHRHSDVPCLSSTKEN